MKTHLSLLIVALLALCVWSCPPADADSSHARIVRLSLVQGDVRYAESFRQDSLDDSHASWQAAPLNLPMREGYALATDNGRAEVELEDGAMLFLSANTVVEFYDLSLKDGGRISRLVLRQGAVIAYVNPDAGDYFSLTGGDFTVEADGRTKFRLNNYDDGSDVSVEQGRVNVLRNGKPTPLVKGQSLMVKASGAEQMILGRSSDSDDFDRWVSGKIESSLTATTYSQQYVNSPTYSSGFADLYTYGSWFPFGGYGYCWRPFGVGLGWSPFDSGLGSWYYDPIFGWSFIGSAPWGWLPYHYGGWVFSPVYGWVWRPTGFGGGIRPLPYHPATAVWVRNNGVVGIVPLHPGDKPGKTPLNLQQGVYPVQGSRLGTSALAAGAEKWSVLREVPRETLTPSAAAPTTAPSRVSRTLLEANGGSRPVTIGRDSTIIYDAREHRFVNSNTIAANTAAEENKTETHGGAIAAEAANAARTPGNPAVPSSASRANVNVPARVPVEPAPVRHVSGGGSYGGGGSHWGGTVGSSHAGASIGSSGSHASGSSSSAGGGHPR